MTTYGTNPTSPNDLAPKLEYITRGNNQHNVRSGLATRRPWKQMLDLRSFNFPRKLATVISRVRANTVYFQTNYTIVFLFSVFLSLIWNPFSLLILLALLGAWLFLYFLRDEPLAVFDREIDHRIVLIGMSVLTLSILFLTDAKLNIAIAIVAGTVSVLSHAAVRKTEDLYNQNDEKTSLLNP
ncbi:PREDICTED: PRA1 family protein F1 isoform X3 [Camelina sativa]|uniref:PRA1 family protein n=1 Tax=Camelina sativa TaxID=90675 RepID=A0ABM0WVX2_CAMSA|nr:PREDICTED: PRA1 family protein F1 isoform X2 [Camelina sativa]XP_010476930.1 PREDICTED: PRA1 family protein F1 isoform X1 [Camelina sativa]XP_010476931.1 PREDICTED: PRA1 family protein F1 isoform X3 [Camelina sativa]